MPPPPTRSQSAANDSPGAVARPFISLHPVSSKRAAPASGADPELRHSGVQDERHRQRHDQERPEPLFDWIGHADQERGDEDQARSGDGQSYSERPDHPLPVQRHPPSTNVEKAFDQGEEEKAPEQADYNPLGPTALWDHQRHEQGAQPDHQTDGDEHPSGPAVVGEVSRADAPDELEWCDGQVDSAENHVQCYEDREVQESGVIGLLKVVSGSSSNADRRQEADRHNQDPSRALTHYPYLPATELLLSS